MQNRRYTRHVVGFSILVFMILLWQNCYSGPGMQQLNLQSSSSSVNPIVDPTPPDSPPAHPGVFSVGWNDLPNTILKNACPPDGFLPEISDGAPYLFHYSCDSVVKAWSGGIFDSSRSRMLLWGGGHGDYGGNEVYALNLNASPITLTRLNNPSGPAVYNSSSPCEAITSPTFPFQSNPTAFLTNPAAINNYAMPDGTPNSRHTYNGLAYIPTADKMFVFGGGVACGNGNHFNDTWLLDLPTLTWKQMNPVNGYDPMPTSGPAYTSLVNWAVYDPATDSVFVFGPGLLQYNYHTNTYTQLNANLSVPQNMTSVLDPVRHQVIFMGTDYGSTAPQVLSVSIAAGSDYAIQDWSNQVQGCTNLAGTSASLNSYTAASPGLAYDPTQDKIVGWPSFGNTAYIFDPVTKVCTAVTYSGGPHDSTDYSGASFSNGTFGRFQYVPLLNAFAVVNSATSDAYLLKLNP